MDSPQIRYVRAADGVTIAYYEMGEGAPFVMMDMPYSHLLSEWRRDETEGGTYHNIPRMARLIRYDHRTFGLSEREVADISLDAFVSDLEAVVDKLELPLFDLYAGRGPTTPIAIAFVARHPERVRRLVLYNASLAMPEAMHKELGALLALESADWKFVSENVSRLVQGWDDDASSKALASLLRDSIDLAGFKRWFGAYGSWNVEGLAPLVRARTLLTAVRDHPWFGPEQARPVAALLPDAQMFVVDATTSADRGAQTVAAVSDFLGAPSAAARQTARATAGTAIILFADIADSTALTERMGDTAFREKARALDDALRAAIREHEGNVIEGKLLGDGVLATFPAASQAIAAALTLEAAAAPTGLGLHIGLHAGDVIRESDNVFGGAVNIAARISALAPPGEVFVSRTVADLARTSAGVTFEDRGEHALKGIAEPQRVFAVRKDAQT